MDQEREDYADRGQPPPSHRWAYPVSALIVLVAILVGLNFLFSWLFDGPGMTVCESTTAG
jgi:hypothetical protein